MGTIRLEAFSDAVLAIIITIMVLEMKTPHSTEWSALQPLLPTFFSYVMSFAYLGIYWNNHHHMLHMTQRINGRTLWANMHLLFWLSLVPFVTGWMGENNFAPKPLALYGVVLLMSAIAYTILKNAIICHESANQELKDALGKDFKGKISIACYVAAIAVSFWQSWISIALYVLVAVIWFVPDRRIESRLQR